MGLCHRKWVGSVIPRSYRKLGIKIHVGKVFEICVEKGSELEKGNPLRKYKGRTVFQGNNVKDEASETALFAELGSSPANMEAGKSIDCYGCMPGNKVSQSDGKQAYTQALMKGVKTVVRIPRNRWPKEWIGKYKDPVVDLRIALYGHPDSGGLWEKHCEAMLNLVGFRPLHPDCWSSMFWHDELRLLLAVYVDDFKMAGPAENIDKGWKLISGKIDMEPPEDVGRYLGCEHVTTRGVKLTAEHHPFAHVYDHTIQDPANQPAAAAHRSQDHWEHFPEHGVLVHCHVQPRKKFSSLPRECGDLKLGPSRCTEYKPCTPEGDASERWDNVENNKQTGLPYWWTGFTYFVDKNVKWSGSMLLQLDSDINFGRCGLANLSWRNPRPHRFSSNALRKQKPDPQNRLQRRSKLLPLDPKKLSRKQTAQNRSDLRTCSMGQTPLTMPSASLRAKSGIMLSAMLQILTRSSKSLKTWEMKKKTVKTMMRFSSNGSPSSMSSTTRSNCGSDEWTSQASTSASSAPSIFAQGNLMSLLFCHLGQTTPRWSETTQIPMTSRPPTNRRRVRRWWRTSLQNRYLSESMRSWPRGRRMKEPAPSQWRKLLHPQPVLKQNPLYQLQTSLHHQQKRENRPLKKPVHKKRPRSRSWPRHLRQDHLQRQAPSSHRQSFQPQSSLLQSCPHHCCPRLPKSIQVLHRMDQPADPRRQEWEHSLRACQRKQCQREMHHRAVSLHWQDGKRARSERWRWFQAKIFQVWIGIREPCPLISFRWARSFQVSFVDSSRSTAQGAGSRQWTATFSSISTKRSPTFVADTIDLLTQRRQWRFWHPLTDFSSGSKKAARGNSLPGSSHFDPWLFVPFRGMMLTSLRMGHPPRRSSASSRWTSSIRRKSTRLEQGLEFRTICSSTRTRSTPRSYFIIQHRQIWRIVWWWVWSREGSTLWSRTSSCLSRPRGRSWALKMQQWPRLEECASSWMSKWWSRKDIDWWKPCRSISFLRIGSPTSASFAPMTWTPMSSSMRTKGTHLPDPSLMSTTPKTSNFGRLSRRGEGNLSSRPWRASHQSTASRSRNHKLHGLGPVYPLEPAVLAAGTQENSWSLSSAWNVEPQQGGTEVLWDRMHLEGVGGENIPGGYHSEWNATLGTAVQLVGNAPQQRNATEHQVAGRWADVKPLCRMPEVSCRLPARHECMPQLRVETMHRDGHGKSLTRDPHRRSRRAHGSGGLHCRYRWSNITWRKPYVRTSKCKVDPRCPGWACKRSCKEDDEAWLFFNPGKGCKRPLLLFQYGATGPDSKGYGFSESSGWRHDPKHWSNPWRNYHGHWPQVHCQNGGCTDAQTKSIRSGRRSLSVLQMSPYESATIRSGLRRYSAVRSIFGPRPAWRFLHAQRGCHHRSGGDERVDYGRGREADLARRPTLHWWAEAPTGTWWRKDGCWRNARIFGPISLRKGFLDSSRASQLFWPMDRSSMGTVDSAAHPLYVGFGWESRR